MSSEARRYVALPRRRGDAAATEAIQALMPLGAPVAGSHAAPPAPAAARPLAREPVRTRERGGVDVARPRPPAQVEPASVTQARAQSGHRYSVGDRLRTVLAATRWELVFVLCAQVVLSARLFGMNTAFGDEALYLYAGRLEIAHWLHGAAIPAFPTYFSGAPVIYPPIAAMADSLGGLAAARAFSLVCMLGATIFLWAITSRLFERRAAFFAAGSWAVLGPTLHVASFATYDAFALLLIAAATWCVLHVGDDYDAASWMLAGGTVLALANAVLYSSVLYDPVVVALAFFGAFPRPGLKRALTRASMVAAQAALVGLLLLKLGGHEYTTGLGVTTLSRARGDNSVSAVVHSSWIWVGLLAAMAFAAWALSFLYRLNGGRRAMLLVFAVAVLLAPFEQARLHTLVSLNKHVDFGAWFAAAAVGYFAGGVAAWPRARLARGVTSAVLVGAFGILAIAGARQSTQMTTWPGAAKLVADVRPHTTKGAHFLAETDSVLEYYLPDTSWRQWSSTASITLPTGRVQNEKGAVKPYIQAIEHHYFSIVVLSFTSTPAIDARITKALRSNKSYRIIAKVPFSGAKQGYYTVWALEHHGTRRARHS